MTTIFGMTGVSLLGVQANAFTGIENCAASLETLAQRRMDLFYEHGLAMEVSNPVSYAQKLFSQGSQICFIGKQTRVERSMASGTVGARNEYGEPAANGRAPGRRTLTGNLPVQRQASAATEETAECADPTFDVCEVDPLLEVEAVPEPSPEPSKEERDALLDEVRDRILVSHVDYGDAVEYARHVIEKKKAQKANGFLDAVLGLAIDALLPSLSKVFIGLRDIAVSAETLAKINNVMKQKNLAALAEGAVGEAKAALKSGFNKAVQGGEPEEQGTADVQSYDGTEIDAFLTQVRVNKSIMTVSLLSSLRNRRFEEIAAFYHMYDPRNANYAVYLHGVMQLVGMFEQTVEKIGPREIKSWGSGDWRTEWTEQSLAYWVVTEDENGSRRTGMVLAKHTTRYGDNVYFEKEIPEDLQEAAEEKTKRVTGLSYVEDKSPYEIQGLPARLGGR